MKKLMVLAMVAACAATVLAQTREWVGAANGVWSEPSNWDPEGTPATYDILKFTDRGAYPSENDLDSAVVGLWFDGNEQPIEITGKPFSLNANNALKDSRGYIQACVLARTAKAAITIWPAVTRTGDGNTDQNICGNDTEPALLTFKGKVTGMHESAGCMNFDGGFSGASPYADFWGTPSANLHFNSTDNSVSGTFTVYNDATLHMGCANAFSSAKVNTLTIGGGTGTKNGTVNLHGYDQSVKKLSGGSLATSVYAVTSPTPALLRVSGSSNMNGLTVVFQGGAGFEMDADAKTVTCSLARASSTTGTLAVTKGVVTLNAAWSQAKTVSVGAEGQLNLAVAGALSAQAAVTVADGGVLNIAENCDCTVLKLVLPDAGEVDPGEWGSPESGAPNTSTALAGKGRILVTGEKSAATWAGDDAADGIAVASNWKVGGAVAESINVTGGGLLATFAESGTHATVDRATSFDGLVFTAPAFAFAKTGGGAVGVGEKGITAAAAESRTVTFEPAVRVMANQTWNLAAGNTLVLNGGLTGGTAITKTGAGGVTINGPIDATGTFTYSGNPTTGALTINTDTVSCPLVVSASGNDDAVVVRKDMKTTFLGKVTYGNNAAIQPSGSAVVEYAGGFQGTVLLRPKDTAKIVFSGQPATFTGGTYYDSGSHEGVEFAVRGNKTNEDQLFYLYSGANGLKTVKCTVPWAFDYAFNLSFGHNSDASVNQAVLDISGGDQGIRNMSFQHKPGNGYKLVVRSTGDSVLHVLNPAANFYATFEGGAGFALTNTADKVVTIDSVSTSTGRVCVAAGTLTFKEGATWVNASKLEVSGGKLCVPRKGIFANKELAVELTGGVLELGEVQRAKSVSVGGTVYTQGTVGAVGSGADVETALIEGSGILKLKTGLMVILK